MKSNKFSINSSLGRLEIAGNPGSGTQTGSDPGSRGEGRWDLFFNPDRFFSRVFQDKKLSLGLPLIILLVSILPTIIFWRIVAAFYDTYVPYGQRLNSGMEFMIALALILVLLFAIAFFPLMTDFPESMNYCYICTRRWREYKYRAMAAFGYAIVPLIVCQFIGVIALGIILPGVAIIPPPTDAYAVYHQADTEYHSVFLTLSSTGNGYGESDAVVAKHRQAAHTMMISMNSAGNEARSGTKQVTSELIRDPVICTFCAIMIILAILATLWTGVLLSFGMRYAMNITLSSAAGEAGILLCGLPFMIYYLAMLIFRPFF